MMNKIGIIGNGFVGSAILHGFILHVEDVLIYDADPSRSTHSLLDVVNESNIVFVCLPTPMFESGECDLSIIDSVLTEINNLEVNKEEKIFVLKSTIVPGTTDHFSRKFPDLSFVFNPEFLTERRARLDFINTARIVLGGDKVLTDKVEKLYRVRFPYTQIIKTSTVTAEMIKYMCNCFFATKVSVMNEFKQISDAIGANWNDAMEGFITDGRIGNSHIDVPGHDGDLGFGGKCFPKDINAIITKAEEFGVDPKVMKAAWEKNKEVRTNLNWYDIPGAVSKKNKE